jgi:hypothetical protein
VYESKKKTSKSKIGWEVQTESDVKTVSCSEMAKFERTISHLSFSFMPFQSIGGFYYEEAFLNIRKR